MSLSLRERIYWFFQECRRCGGAGVLLAKGRRLRKDELTEAQRGWRLATGQEYFYEDLEMCPKCQGSGMRKRKT